MEYPKKEGNSAIHCNNLKDILLIKPFCICQNTKRQIVSDFTYMRYFR